MKKITVIFRIATRYVGSEYSETKEFEFDTDATENEINTAIDEAYLEWLNEKNCGGWNII